MPPNDSDVQARITTFWSTVAPLYNSYQGNVPRVESAEYAAWIRAIERLLPTPPADVLDIGTATGFVALIASQLGHRAIGIDLSTAMLAEARMQADRRCSRATVRGVESGRHCLPALPMDASPARGRPCQLASAFTAKRSCCGDRWILVRAVEAGGL